MLHMECEFCEGLTLELFAIYGFNDDDSKSKLQLDLSHRSNLVSKPWPVIGGYCC